MKNLISGVIILVVGILLFGFSGGSSHLAFAGLIMIILGLLLSGSGLIQVLFRTVRNLFETD